MVTQIISPARQEKKMLMKQLGLKTGKQYRKWEKEQRRVKKLTNKDLPKHPSKVDVYMKGRDYDSSVKDANEGGVNDD